MAGGEFYMFEPGLRLRAILFFNIFTVLFLTKCFGYVILCIMKSINYYDSSYSPNEACEASNIPNCGACADEGYLDDEQSVYCDCPEGERMNFADWEIEQADKAYEHAERCFTDHGYAMGN